MLHPETQLPEVDRILEGFRGADELPGYLRISLLEDCNERCFFCHNEGYRGRKSVIDENLMWSVIAASEALGKIKFKFTGGEPTTHPRLVYYVRELRQRIPRGEIGIITNGTRLKSLAGALRDAGLNRVNVSLHSIRRDTYRRITARDALPAALSGLEAATAAGFSPIVINTVVSDLNLTEIEELITFAADHGYELRLLDIVSPHAGVRAHRVPHESLHAYAAAVKPKLFHPKCGGCAFRSVCGEAEYLRLSANGTLDPCMYRVDLKVRVSASDHEALMVRKLALAFRRVCLDDL